MMSLADATQSQSFWTWILPLVTGIGGVWLGQMLTERRETKSLRIEKRMELYSDIIEFVVAWEDFIAKWDSKSSLLPTELQIARIRLAHRLKLLGSDDTIRRFETFFRDMTHYIDRCATREIPDVDQSKLALVDQLRIDLGIHSDRRLQCWPFWELGWQRQKK